MSYFQNQDDRIVITGIGMIASVGNDRESVWQAIQRGTCGISRIHGLRGIPDGMTLAAMADVEPEVPGELKVLSLAKRAADEAMEDAQFDRQRIDSTRFGCSVSGHMGDLSWDRTQAGQIENVSGDRVHWVSQWLPNSLCNTIANRFELLGPRTSHMTACASGTISLLSAQRQIFDNQCDIVLTGSSQAIHELLIAGFYKMRVLAENDDPTKACRPFDVNRNGFVMGEGSAFLVLERLSHALRRGATIYAEILGGKTLADAHHVTGLDTNSDTLTRLIDDTLQVSKLSRGDIDYINAHGTGTEQNDVMETRGIRRALKQAADHVCVSSAKAQIGHLVNASGGVELAITTLALRDGFAPPTVNLTDQDPDCDLDYVPLEGRPFRFDHALKFSVAFGGHFAAVALRRWNDAKSGFEYASRERTPVEERKRVA